jgi:hypothetical protein
MFGEFRGALMTLNNRRLKSTLAAAALAAAVMAAGCTGVGVSYRAYDPYRSDYHVWNANEGVYYNQWTVETHRDSHRDYRKLKKDEQSQYWKWRHDHPDHR